MRLRPVVPYRLSPPGALPLALQVPEVHVTAKAFLPSTSLVTFELAGGLAFTTFVSTCPISGERVGLWGLQWGCNWWALAFAWFLLCCRPRRPCSQPSWLLTAP